MKVKLFFYDRWVKAAGQCTVEDQEVAKRISYQYKISTCSLHCIKLFFFIPPPSISLSQYINCDRLCRERTCPIYLVFSAWVQRSFYQYITTVKSFTSKLLRVKLVIQVPFPGATRLGGTQKRTPSHMSADGPNGRTDL